MFAKRGVMRVETAAGAWVVPPERALWMPAGIDHGIRCVTAVAMSSVYLATAAGRDRAEPAVLGVTPLLREVILRLVEGGGGDRAALLPVLMGEVAAVSVAPLHLPEPADPRLRQLCAALRADPGGTIALSAHARAAGASERTIMRLFAAETGMTFRAWQRRLRFLAALERLAAGEPVTRVALELGYAGPSTFIASFRLALGTTPARCFRPAGDAASVTRARTASSPPAKPGRACTRCPSRGGARPPAGGGGRSGAGDDRARSGAER